MAEERKSMELNGLPAPAIGGEERSDEIPIAGAGKLSARFAAPDPEVVAKPKRRRFSAEYRLRIVEEADRCTQSGDVGRLLRREGLYSSHLTKWREARRDGALRGLTSKKRGAKPKASNPLEPRVRELEAQVARLEKDLHTAHTILDVQKKVAGLLGFNLEDGKDC
jgi:transposase-like protein